MVIPCHPIIPAPGESTAGGGRPDGAAGAGDRGLPCLATCVSEGSWVKWGDRPDLWQLIRLISGSSDDLQWKHLEINEVSGSEVENDEIKLDRNIWKMNENVKMMINNC
jgi:hypothetical protein